MPTQRLYTITFSPSESCTVAPTGQTTSQGACSQCMHSMGWKKLVGRVGFAFVIAIDAQPVHFALMHHLLLADDGNVVLGLAGDDAGVAADAGVQIDTHRPSRRPLRFPAIKMRFLFSPGEKAWFLGVLRERAVSHNDAGHVEDQVVMIGAA